MFGLGMIELVLILAVVVVFAAVTSRRRKTRIMEETIDTPQVSDSDNPYAPSNVSRRVVKEPGSRLGIVMLLAVIASLIFVGAILGFSIVRPVPAPPTAPPTAPVVGSQAAPANSPSTEAPDQTAPAR